ncbi:MAG: hypothetical protein IH991_08810, partial [Planctomycetes bacterium]|nr:hypothetical protein [Planctomycetota bacterium]
LDAIAKEIERMEELRKKGQGDPNEINLGGARPMGDAGGPLKGGEPPGGALPPGVVRPGAVFPGAVFPGAVFPGAGPNAGGPGDALLPGADFQKQASVLEPYKLLRSRRRMKAVIQYVRRAIGLDEDSGIRKYSKNKGEKKDIQLVTTALTGLMKATDATPSKKSPEPTKALTDAVALGVQEVENEIRALAPAAAPAEAAPPAGLFPEAAAGPTPGKAAPDS